MDEALARANLQTSGRVEIVVPEGTSTVRISRMSDWSGSPVFAHWIVMAAIYRLIGLLRRDRRWAVRVDDARQAKGELIHQVLGSKEEAIQRAVLKAQELGERT